MFKNFKIVVITPAGRKRYLEILFPYIYRDKGLIDEYHLWVNTSTISDIKYIESLYKHFPNFVKLIYGNIEPNGSLSVYQFYDYCTENKTIYIKIDDDICFIEEGAIEELVKFRVANPQYFLVYANIVNNVLCSHLHQRMGMLTLSQGECTYDPFCDLGWKSEKIASYIHSNFLNNLKDCKLDNYKYKQWILHEFERTSINFISWFGKDFAEFDGKVCSDNDKDDEQWLSVYKPRQVNKFNCICGTALVVHFAYYTQRECLESQTNSLQKYKEISEKIAGNGKMISESAKCPKISPVQQGVDRPFWSVMIPTYNCADYLVETLKSVLEQDPGSENMQIEVVDDCSTKDDPEAVVKEHGKGRVSFFRQPRNVGAQLNFNTCIERAKGQWVHILHGDDTVLPGCYKRFQEAIEKESTIGAAFCRIIYIDEKSNWRSFSQLERETPGILSDCLERLVIFNYIMTPSIVVKRSVYEELGGFHLELFHSCDWDMWKRIATTYPVWYEPQPLACYRQHSNSDTLRLMRSGANIADGCMSIGISESYIPRTIAADLSNYAREHHALYAFQTAYRMFTNGDNGAAIAQIREGIKCSQSPKVIKTMFALVEKLTSDSNQLATISDLYDLLPINALAQFLTEFQFNAELHSCADKYQKDPSNQSVLVSLQQFRQEVAQKCLSLPPAQLESMYLGELGKAHKILLDSGVKNQPSTDSIKSFVNGCKNLDNSEAINYLLAAMLYHNGYELSLPHDLTYIPQWLVNVYLKFIFESPSFFQEGKEVDRYFNHIKRWIDYLYQNIFNNHESRKWQDIALFVIQNTNFIFLDFTNITLSNLYRKRLEIIEFALKISGDEIDIENLNLRKSNFIIFPDWSQPEDLLYQDLASVITSLMNHPDINQITLLIDRGNLTEEEATLFVSGVVMNLVMEEGLDVADELEISLVGQLNEMQWEVLSPRINARIVLEHENQQAIAQNKVEKIPTYEIPSFSELTSVLT